MKQINFKQIGSQGKIDGILRIKGKELYFKFNNSSYANQIISQMREKGAIIEEGKGWIKVDLFHGINEGDVKFGDIQVDINETSDEDFEEVLTKFYEKKYIESKFIVEVKEI